MTARPRSHQLEDESWSAFRAALRTEWVVREVQPDYGIDATVEIFTPAGDRTARSFHVQLKATDEPDVRRALTRRIRFSLELVDYYRALPIPLLVVLFHAPSGQLYARWFHADDPHISAKSQRPAALPQKLPFRLAPADAWTTATPGDLDDAVRGFLVFRNPSLPRPLPLAVHADSEISDLLPVTFALRTALNPVADLIRVEARTPTADEARVTLSASSSRISLARVASVTLEHNAGGARDSAALGRDLAVALAVALTRVGQANLAAQIGLATAANSQIITDFDVSFALAGAMFEARRLREAIALADVLDDSEEPDVQLAAAAFELALLSARRLSEADRALAVQAAERRIDRRLNRGERAYAAAAAYTLAMKHRAARAAQLSIDAFNRAAELDPDYGNRAYFHRDVAGSYFESGNFADAADHYHHAIELGDTGLVEALYADALLFAGRYAEAAAQFDRYLATDRGPQGAEWRLKRACLLLVRTRGGDRQPRDPDTAEWAIEPVDFRRGTICGEEALTALATALAADACSGEAWFRLSIIQLGMTEDLAAQASAMLTAATLLRHATRAWINALIAAGIDDEQHALDILSVAYRYNGADFVDELVRSMQQDTHLEASMVLGLLDRAVATSDQLELDTGVILRLNDDEGGVREVILGEVAWAG